MGERPVEGTNRNDIWLVLFHVRIVAMDFAIGRRLYRKKEIESTAFEGHAFHHDQTPGQVEGGGVSYRRDAYLSPAALRLLESLRAMACHATDATLVQLSRA
jgi:hypothetical protein